MPKLETSQTNIALIGCGFVGDLYAATLRLHPALHVSGIFDRDAERTERFAKHYGYRSYKSLGEVLADDAVKIVVNLTNPSSHYEISHAALASGKHVYSEKPLAMHLEHARQLVALAESRNLQLSSAPCSLLGETAQTFWKAIRESAVGKVRLVYAELDDGLVHKMQYHQWKSQSGTPWPWKDEFEVGCTLEHAGYYVTWLVAMFGQVQSLTAFSSSQIPDKQTESPLNTTAPDFSVACLRFTSGIVARLTCGIIAPHDHTLRVIGDEGVISTPDCWLYESPIHIQRLMTLRRKTFLTPWRQRVRLQRSPYQKVRRTGAAQMDFARGIYEMADALQHGRTPRLSSRFSLHVNEIVLAIQNAGVDSPTYHCTTTVDPVQPEAWAS